MDYKHTCDTIFTHFQGITNIIYGFGRPFLLLHFLPVHHISTSPYSFYPSNGWVDGSLHKAMVTIPQYFFTKSSICLQIMNETCMYPHRLSKKSLHCRVTHIIQYCSVTDNIACCKNNDKYGVHRSTVTSRLSSSNASHLWCKKCAFQTLNQTKQTPLTLYMDWYFTTLCVQMVLVTLTRYMTF